MIHPLPVAAALVVICSFAARAEAPTGPGANDWPAWRGPSGDGIAAADQHPPLHWSETQNVLWKAKVPGRGHSSPTVAGDNVYLATADEDREIQSVLCYDRQTGEQRWATAVHEGGLDRKGNKKATQASSTVACDGERLYINFLNRGAIYTTALDLAGKQLWQTKVSDFKTHQGFGSSPTLHGGLVYVTSDSPSGGVLAALDCTTGEFVWKHSRPEKPNYASAVICRVAGQQQVLLQGCDLVSAFDPASGKKLWEVEGSTTECVTSLVSDGERIFASGGYPKRHVQALLADGSGKTAWENSAPVYVPSMIVHEGFLYAMQDNGVAVCWKCDTGEEMWKSRVGGTFSASLVLAGNMLFATSEAAKTSVFAADPTQFSLVAENQLGDEAYATPAVCGGHIYLRIVEQKSGGRQEWLYCLGD